jgi:integrase
MIRPRSKPDGLPPRVYERFGKRTYSIGHKADSGAWSFRLSCPLGQRAKIAELRLQAVRKAAEIDSGAPADGSFAALAKAWLKWQRELPAGTPGKRADSTLKENEREIAALNRSFDDMQVAEMEKGDAYDHLDACLIAKDKKGNPRPRPEKGNKEIALAHVMLEWAVRRRWIKSNPFDGVEKLVTEKAQRAVTAQELCLAVEVGRKLGGPQHIVALACKTAWLCVRRSVEVRAMTRDQIDAERGIFWKAAKRQAGQAEKVGLIEWSPELRATIDEALAIKRNKLAGAWYVFGNLRGQKYTKGGWKKTLSVLMHACVEEAAKRKLAFASFSLQDCRPMGVSDKLARGDRDVQDATLHSSERMIRQVYDRRRVRVAKPAG